MDFCPTFLFDAESGELVGLTAVSQIKLLPGDYSSLPGTQFACIGTRTAEVTPAKVLIDDQIFLFGDARMRLG